MSGSLTYVPGVVTFDYARWSLAYPQFAATVTSASGQVYFILAQSYCDNTAQSPVTDFSIGGQRETFLWLVTAHIAQLSVGSSAAAATGAVGRVASASEGSVSVSLSLPEPTDALEGFFYQTQFGLMYWAATAQFRVFRPNPYGRQFNQVTPLGTFPAGAAIPYLALLRANGWF